MKNIIITILLLCFHQTGNSQPHFSLESPELDAIYANKANAAIISRQFINFTPEDLQQYKLEFILHVPIGEFQKIKLVDVNKDGSFKFQLENALPYQEIYLKLDEILYTDLLVSKNLHIELDIKKLKKDTVFFCGEGIRFIGEDADIIEMINKDILLKQSENIDLSSQEALEIAKSPHYWIIQNWEKSKFFKEILWSHCKSRQVISEDTLTQILAHQPITISSESNGYYRILNFYIDSQYKRKTMQGIDNLQLNPRKAALVLMQTGYPILYQNEKYFVEIMPRLDTFWCKDFMAIELEKTKENIRSINEQIQRAKSDSVLPKNLIFNEVTYLDFGAELFTTNCTDIDSLIAEIRANNPEKAIIFDVWATWCGPCISDMKGSKATKEQLKAMNVEVVYLCSPSNSSVSSWQQLVTETETQGTHIFMNKKLETQLKKKFEITFYPTFIFINKSGVYHKGLVTHLQNYNLKLLKDKL
jgi:thiol-disulfide isomerase/thioredoxin